MNCPRLHSRLTHRSLGPSTSGLSKVASFWSLLLALTFTLPLTSTAQNQTINGNLTVTGTIEADGQIDTAASTLTFGSQGSSYGGALLHQDNGTDTFTFLSNRSPASWLWQHTASIAAMRLDANHQLILYQSNGTTAGITLTPASNQLSLGAATLTASGTALTTNGALTVAGNLTNSSTSATTSFMGNVGVGTATPGAKLDVFGGDVKTRFGAWSADYTGIQIGAESTERPRIGFHVSDNSRRFKIEVNSVNTANERLGFFATAGGAIAETEFLTLNKDGNVGIGTTSPGAKLDVLGAIRGSSNADFFNTLFVRSNQVGIQNNSPLSGASLDIRGGALYVDQQTWLNGNVGIGMTNPDNKLTIDTGGALGFYRSASTKSMVGVDYAHVDGGSGDIMRFLGSVSGASFDRVNMVIARTTGNVGIGTTTPSAPLSIRTVNATPISPQITIDNQYFPAGSGTEIRFRHASDETGHPLYDVGAIQMVQTSALPQADMGFWAGSNRGGTFAERMRITSSGNVGISETNPAEKLQITGSSGTIRSYLRMTDAAGTAEYKLTSDTGDTRLGVHGSVAGGDTYLTSVANYPLWFGTNNAERMRITEGGNVGIGTTSPEAAVHLQRSSPGATTTLFIDNSAPSTLNNAAAIRFAVDAGATVTNGGAQIAAINTDANNGATALAFTNFSGASNVETMRISPNGNVGIGTTTPTEKLEVTGNLKVAGTLTAANLANTGNVGIGTANPQGSLQIGAPGMLSTGQALGTGNPNGFYMGSNFKFDGGWRFANGPLDANQMVFNSGANSSWDFNVADGTGKNTGDPLAWTTALSIKPNGNIGIGTTTPTSKLHVAGNRNAFIVQDQVAAMPDGNSYDVGGIVYNDGFLRDTVGSNPAAYLKIRSINTNSSWPTTIRGTQLEFGTADGAVGQGVQASTRLTVTPGGNVGIGTTNPAANLVIQNNAPGSTWMETLSVLSPNATNDSSHSSGIYFGRARTTDQLAHLTFVPSATTQRQQMRFGFWDRNDLMTLEGTGNVGIGTTTPATRLMVADDNVASGGVTIGTGTAADGGNLRLLSSTNHWNLDNHTGDLRFFTETGYGTGGVVRMTLTKEGNLNIGGNFTAANFAAGSATLPNQAITIRGSNAGTSIVSNTDEASSLFLSNKHGGANTFADIRFEDAGGNSVAGVAGVFVNDATNQGDLAFTTRDSGQALSEKMRILGNGNVGIGTSSPTEALTLGAGKNLLIGSTDTAGGALLFRRGFGTADPTVPALGGAIFYDHNGGTLGTNEAFKFVGEEFRFRQTTVGTDLLTIKTNGNVGVGTSTPGGLLGLGQRASGLSAPKTYTAASGTQIDSYYTNSDFERYLDFVANGQDDGNPGGSFRFFTKPASYDAAPVERMRIAAGGNVGIGIITPKGKLDVAHGNTNPQGLGDVPIDALRIEQGPGYGVTAIRTTAGTSPADGDMQFFNLFYNGATYNWHERMRIKANGNVGIGTTAPTHTLSVKGTIRAQEIIVDNTNWADYVFEEDYRLAPLAEVESHIKEKGHLPGIPSAAEVGEHGLSMGEMQSKLLSKVEELTLHLIAQEKKLEAVTAENARLTQRVQTLEATAANP